MALDEGGTAPGEVVRLHPEGAQSLVLELTAVADEAEEKATTIQNLVARVCVVTNAPQGLREFSDWARWAAQDLRWRTDVVAHADEAFRSDGGMVGAILPPAPSEELAPEGGLSARALAGLVADLAGILDPTPISDGISGVIDLSEGDLLGTGLSLASMIPYLGDAAAKPVKILKAVTEAFPALKRLGGADDVLNAVKHVDLRAPDRVDDALGTLNRLHHKAERAYRYPRWLDRARQLNLPTHGPVPFVPPKNWNPSVPQTDVLNGRKGYVDAFGNVWSKGPGRGGDPWEWDVQVVSGMARPTKDGAHLNASRRGRITH